ncbi:MAG: hypothetical protein WAW52_10260 [Methanothrix sp.]
MHRTPSGDHRQALQKAARALAIRREAERLQGEAEKALAEAGALIFESLYPETLFFGQ